MRPYLMLLLLPYVEAWGNQLGLCHYLKLIGKRSTFCGDPPLNTVSELLSLCLFETETFANVDAKQWDTGLFEYPISNTPPPPKMCELKIHVGR